jgi:hypothetical protein
MFRSVEDKLGFARFRLHSTTELFFANFIENSSLISAKLFSPLFFPPHKNLTLVSTFIVDMATSSSSNYGPEPTPLTQIETLVAS